MSVLTNEIELMILETLEVPPSVGDMNDGKSVNSQPTPSRDFGIVTTISKIHDDFTSDVIRGLLM